MGGWRSTSPSAERSTAPWMQPRAGLEVTARDLPALVDLGREIKLLLEAEREYVDPLEPELRDIYGVIFFQDEEPARLRSLPAQRHDLRRRGGRSLALRQRHVGSARAARCSRAARAREPPHPSQHRRQYVHGARGRRAGVAGMHAVVTEVEGSAHPTGRHEFVLVEDDPLGTGFLLR